MRNRRLTRFSVPVIIVLILGAMLIVALLNQSWFDILWIIMSLTLGGLITFLYLAPRLLPIEATREERSGANRVFGDYLRGIPVPMLVVRDGKIFHQNSAARAAAREFKAPPGLPKVESEDLEDYLGYGVIVSDSTSLIALRAATGLTRIVGPRQDAQGRSISGVVFTSLEENLDSIIDLRPQIRVAPVQAQTRDGITLTLSVIVLYTLQGTRALSMRELVQLQQTRQPWPPPFTWRHSSAYKAIAGRRIETKEGRAIRTEWGDRVLAATIPQLRQLIAQQTCDQLTAPLGTDKHPRFKIRDELMRSVQNQLASTGEYARDSGLRIIFMAVTMMTPPQQVIAQRVEAWRREWKKKETEVMGRAEAEAILMREQARAQVQGEMTARINDALREAKASGTNNSDLITLRFLEAMEKMAKDPTTRALLTLDSLKILKQLREMLTPESPS